MKKYFLFTLLAVFLVACDQTLPDDPTNGGGQINVPTPIVTGDANHITHKSAILYGEVNLEVGKDEEIEYGMIFSKDTKDMAELNSPNAHAVYSTDALVENVYSVSLSGLEPETKYYYRALLHLKGKQYWFGNVKVFSTAAAPGVNEITINTGAAEDITYYSVVLSGEIEADFTDYTSIKYGISYATNIDDLQSNSGNLVYSSDSLLGNKFSVFLNRLESQTQYYYCAFVYANENDYKYGSINSFTTLEGPEVHGIGIFSVSSTQQVTFSPGNLQYHPANDEWRIAANQTDYVGKSNENISSDYNGWIDLFGWSTSATYYGVHTSKDGGSYYGTFVDWGSNMIGDHALNTWRTLTDSEWRYLQYNRANADSLIGVAQVNGVNGLILLPDNWSSPQGVTFKSGFDSTFTAEQWRELEAAGAVFLPAAGTRYGSSVNDVQEEGCYWLADSYTPNVAKNFRFDSEGAYGGYSDRKFGYSVRLVKDL